MAVVVLLIMLSYCRGIHSTKNRRCIFVSNDHADAMQEWLLADSETKISAVATVLHVDAHNDLNVPVPDIKDMHPLYGQKTRKQLQQNSQLRNETVSSTE